MNDRPALASSDDTASLHTPRLLLRPVQAADAHPLFALFNNWEVIRMLGTPPWPYALKDAEDFVATRINPAPDDEQVRAITLGGDFIGCIGFRFTKANHLQSGDGPHIGYWIGQPFWRKGYMTEALRALVADIFVRHPLDAIYSGVIADNVASLRVQEKVGFARDRDGLLNARPRGEQVPHIGTILTRAAFERAKPHLSSSRHR